MSCNFLRNGARTLIEALNACITCQLASNSFFFFALFRLVMTLNILLGGNTPLTFAFAGKPNVRPVSRRCLLGPVRMDHRGPPLSKTGVMERSIGETWG